MPIYIKRFRITLSILLSGVQIVLGVVLPVRADDYRINQNEFEGIFFDIKEVNLVE